MFLLAENVQKTAKIMAFEQKNWDEKHTESLIYSKRIVVLV